MSTFDEADSHITKSKCDRQKKSQKSPAFNDVSLPIDKKKKENLAFKKLKTEANKAENELARNKSGRR